MTSSPENAPSSSADDAVRSPACTTNDEGEIFTVKFDKLPKGLGVKILGGVNEDGGEDCPIYIAEVLPGGLVAERGLLQVGDQLLSINGVSLGNVTNDQAVELLSEASQNNPLELEVVRKNAVNKTDNKERVIVLFDSVPKGLGIKIIGGLGEEEGMQDFGIFIGEVLPGGLAENDGTLQEGDQLLSVNGQSLENVTNEHAVQLLRYASATNYLELVVARDDIAREQYQEMLLGYSYSSTDSECDRTSLVSEGNQYDHLASLNSQSLSGASFLPTQSPRQRCEGSSSGSEHGSVGGVASTSHQTPSSPVPSHGAGPADKHPRAAAAPVQNHQGVCGTSGAPDGASSGTPDSVPACPRPAVKSEVSDHVTRALSAVGAHSAAAHGYHGTPGGDRGHIGISKLGSRPRRPSIDPSVRLKVSTLEMALKYLGIDPTPEQYTLLRNRLKVDHNNRVVYKDFVEVARDIFKFGLDEKKFYSLPTVTSVNDIKLFTDPPALAPEKDNFFYLNLKKENEHLRNEVKRLKRLLRVREEELIRVRQEAHGAVCESNSLRSKIHLVEQAQKAARNMEQDYGEVIQILEAENRQLRQQTAQPDNPVMQKKMAVLGCQLRKLEVTKKTYEVATDKLLHFVEVVHDTLAGQVVSTSRPESAASRVSLCSINQSKQAGLAHLATEAKDVAKAVRTLLEVEPLPFGWEESYTADGMKYYINHVTQVTSWQHPLSNVQHATSLSSVTDAKKMSMLVGGNKCQGTGTRKKRLPSAPPTSKLKQ